jgi:ferredoxin
MKATVDPDLCVGCELCVQLCPDVFAMKGDVATAVVDEVPTDIEASCRDTAEACPVSAIAVTELLIQV